MTTKFEGPVKATLGYFALYFIFIIFQVSTKFYLYAKAKPENGKPVSYVKIKYGNTDRLAVTGDRSVGNMLEQAIPFLGSLWLHAVFVDPVVAARYGWLYILFRSIYPIGFYMGLPYILCSTIPGYLIIFSLMWEVWKSI